MESNHVRDLMEAYSSIYTENEEVEQLDEDFQGAVKRTLDAGAKATDKFIKTNPVGQAIGAALSPAGPGRKTPTKASGGYRPVVKSTVGEETDLFDIIKGHLLDEGFADTEEAALAIMTNMSEEWREQILDEANRGDEYATSKDHPSLARSKKQKRRNASFDSGATHSKGPRMTSGQQSEIENMPNGGAAEVARQKTLMRQRYTSNTRGIKPKR